MTKKKSTNPAKSECPTLKENDLEKSSSSKSTTIEPKQDELMLKLLTKPTLNDDDDDDQVLKDGRGIPLD